MVVGVEACTVCPISSNYRCAAPSAVLTVEKMMETRSTTIILHAVLPTGKGSLGKSEMGNSDRLGTSLQQLHYEFNQFSKEVFLFDLPSSTTAIFFAWNNSMQANNTRQSTNPLIFSIDGIGREKRCCKATSLGVRIKALRKAPPTVKQLVAVSGFYVVSVELQFPVEE